MRYLIKVHTGVYTETSVIDLSGQPSALLTLEQDFRFCCSNSHTMQLSVSTDGGTTWGNPYDLSFGLAVNTAYSSSNSGYYSFVNISSEAANQSNVKLKFTWNDPGLANSHYYWVLDDIGIEFMCSVFYPEAVIFLESLLYAKRYSQLPF